MADGFFDAWKQAYSGLSPADKKSFDDSVGKCCVAVHGALDGSEVGLPVSEIKRAIDSDLLYFLLMALWKMEADGVIEIVDSSLNTQSFPYWERSYRLKR